MIKKLLSVAMCLLLLISFASCGNDETIETTTLSPVLQSTEKEEDIIPANQKDDITEVTAEDESGNLLITLYNADSDEYHALQGIIESINTGIESDYGMNGFRFVSPNSNVKVRLEGILWSSLVNDFETDYTYFEIETEKDKIYEFDCVVTETIPDFRLVAEYGDMKSTYYFAMDGESVENVVEMTDDEFVPDEITDDTAFYNLCAARAASKVYYEGYVDHNDPAAIWNTVAYAVTLNYIEMNGEDFDEYIGLSTWEVESYMDTMYPECKDAYPQMNEECYVEGSMRQYSDYDVTPYMFENFCTNEFYGVEDNGNGTYSVKIRIDDYRFEGFTENGFAVIVTPDANSPFGYIITDIVDYDLPRG